jgi:hypothetical protein
VKPILKGGQISWKNTKWEEHNGGIWNKMGRGGDRKNAGPGKGK